MSRNETIYQVADELRALASLGLKFAENGYDKERYEHALRLSARLVAALQDKSPDEVLSLYAENLSHFSPLVSVEAAVFREGKLLLIRRKDNGLWAVPGGLSEVGETTSEGALRELWEEAGMHGRVEKILGVFDSRLWNLQAIMHFFSFLYLVESDEEPQLHPAGEHTVSSHLESLDVGFFSEDRLPALSPGHDSRVLLIFKLYRGEAPVPYFD